ncbi:uncharacterized protein [Primulina eburnea]|uniref:uncharacterized protein n=1 Tax=Primulina eburnea TaxID=1245227 RepID=UPI003C6BFBF8
MIILSWNCRGLGHTRAVPNLRELVRAHRPTVIFLYETLTHSQKIEEVKISLGFDGAFSIDREGRSGGIAALWKYSDHYTVIGYSRNHIDLKITEPGQEDWRLTGYYGFPEQRRRREAWNLLKAVTRISQLPWCIIGDFNDILDSSEKHGEVERPIWMIQGFRETVMQCLLQDIQMKVHPFTWEKGRGNTHFVEEKLDRALASTAWMARFPEASVLNTVATCSDHSPLILVNDAPKTKISRISFRFENRWMEEEGFNEVVHDRWGLTETYSTITERLKALSNELTRWSRKHAIIDRKPIDNLKESLERMRSNSDHQSVVQVEEMKLKLNRMMIKNYMYWKQRAKQFWLKEGDLNTKFFHSMEMHLMKQ